MLVGTFGKAFGVNGGFVAGSPELIEAVRQKSDTYIYTNPLERGRLRGGHRRPSRSPIGRKAAIGWPTWRRARASSARASTPSGWSPFPARTRWCRCSCAAPTRCARWSAGCSSGTSSRWASRIPVVPKGDETIRFQVNAAHTEADIDEVLGALRELA